MGTQVVSRWTGIQKFGDAVRPSVVTVAQTILGWCVLTTAESFWPDLPKHSPELTLLRFASVVVGFVLVKAVQWRDKN